MPRRLLLIALGGILLALASACPPVEAPATMTFELRGLHKQVSCDSCHPSGQEPAEAPVDCIGCHLDDRPTPHDPRDCSTCHDESGWTNIAMPDHEVLLSLLGGHSPLACRDCHAPDTYQGLDAACATCHQPDRPANHYEGGCEDCHTVMGWNLVEWNHSLSLGGGHSDLTCQDCHAPDTFSGLSEACATCHEPDRPNGHFGGACETCHQVSGWGNATFNHAPYFPVPHRGVSDCNRCHVNNDSYQTFSCTTGCHGFADMADEHDEVWNFQYNDQACLNCHPDGREPDDD